MKFILYVTIFASAAIGCYGDSPGDGALRCNTQASHACPTNFYCAADGSCWHNGHSPTGSADDMGFDGIDLAAEIFDLSGSASCTADACAGNTLRKCDAQGMFDDTPCSLGCSTSPAPHCSALVPQAPVTASDIDGTGLVPLDVTSALTLHGDTGVIDGVRSANVNPATREVNNGIAFHIANGVAIFSFRSLKVEDGVIAHLAGPNPIAVVAADDIELVGQIEARVCPTGGVGGAAWTPGNQNGGGQGYGSTSSQPYCSGGGAGHGDKGGSGSSDMAMPSDGLGGAIYDAVSLNPLHGGSSGGGGANSSTGGGYGGAGGGAVQLVAGNTVYLGGGAQPGGVNAGGCGGTWGASMYGGGGGGSGGAILVEAANIEFRANGGLAANGGGGGSANNNMSSGGDATLSTMRSAGGAKGGGRGGAAGAPQGESYDFTGSMSGGGGGGVGRIRMNSANGAVFPASYILSPALNDMNALQQPVCSQGTITIQ